MASVSGSGVDGGGQLSRSRQPRPPVISIRAPSTVLGGIRSRWSIGPLAVVGYDDGELATALDLTTVRQPFEESGRTALELVLAIVSGSASGHETVRLAPELIARSSTLGVRPAPR